MSYSNILSPTPTKKPSTTTDDHSTTDKGYITTFSSQSRSPIEVNDDMTIADPPLSSSCNTSGSISGSISGSGSSRGGYSTVFGARKQQ